MLLKEATTCWRAEPAERAAVFIDMEDYFAAVKSAMSKARRSIHLLGWAFDPNTAFEPQEGCAPSDDDRIAEFLKALVRERPDLDVKLLCWKAALPIAATQKLYPQRANNDFADSSVRFEVDDALPSGASHHQKVVVIDDVVAFCGGCDFGPDRWDTCDHVDDDPRRLPAPEAKTCFDARHEVMSLVDGAAAAALGDLFRDRWRRATGEVLAAPESKPRSDPWPAGVASQFQDVRVGLSRSGAAWRAWPQVRENETLYLASIAAATSCIYMENQYFTAPVIAEALAQRLAEPDGPEIILVSTAHSPSYFDQMTMDRTRSLFIKRLREADKHGRFQIYSPVTSLGHTIIVHAKLAIIDDVLLRIGSSNMNNRSLGFDSECDLSIEPKGPSRTASRAAIRGIRTRLIAHWLGCEDQEFEAAVKSSGGIGPAIEALRARGLCRLRPIPQLSLKPLAALIATFHIGDPAGPVDCWRPWSRRTRLKAEMAKSVAALKAAGLDHVKPRISPKTV